MPELSEVLTSNYDYILSCAERITKDRSVGQELMNEVYLDIAEKGKEYPSDGLGFSKWFVKYMKLMHIAPRSKFSKSRRVYSDIELPEVKDDSLDAIELMVESATPATKELINLSSSMKRERVMRYVEVIEFKKALPLHEQYLFELYYGEGLSTRDIARQMTEETGYTINYQGINKMMNSIKTKIKSRKWS